MAADKKSGASKTKFLIRIAPYASISHKLLHGRASEIDPALLAGEIRAHGFEKMPDEVRSYLCEFLEGKVEKRGRKGNSPIERGMEGLRAQDYYDNFREVREDRPSASKEAVELYDILHPHIEDSYSPSEGMWRMVALLMFANQGHHKKIKNLAGKANSAKKSNTGKPVRK